MILLSGGGSLFFDVQTQFGKVFSEEEMMRRNNFFVVSMFNWGCRSSRDYFFIIRVIRLDKGFSEGRNALDMFS